MKLGVVNPEGTGNFVLLDLPIPMEPVIIDMDRPLEDQLAGQYLEAAKKMIEEEGL